MKKTRNLLFFTSLFIITTGIIKCQISEIQFDNWTYKCSFTKDSGKFIINSKEDFKKIANCILINYDFNKYTIIGVQGSVEGCRLPTIDFKITRNDYNKEYIIEAIVLSYGNCRRNNGYKRIIYTEKLINDYNIVFIKNEKAYSNE